MAASRKELALLLVIVGSLLLIMLQIMAAFFYNQPKPKQSRPRPLFWLAPLLKTTEEQVIAGNTLHQMMIKDPVVYRCTNIRTIKNQKEAGGFWSYCEDKNFAIKKPCLVYSFGINYDFGFDDAMGQLGCEVFSFDPSMNTSTHRRNAQVMFYQVGLGWEDTDTFRPKLNQYVKRKTFWKVRTLQSLLRESNPLNRTIDLLKMDIEGSEWAVVRNMLDTGALSQVKQLLLEWHVFPSSPARKRFHRLIELLDNLEKAGFKPFHRNKHPVNLTWDRFNLQSDTGYVNVNFLTE